MMVIDEILNWGTLVAYFGIGAWFARTRVTRWHRLAREDHKRKYAHAYELIPDERGFYALGAVLLGVIWPVGVIWYGVMAWLWKPVDRDLARQKRLKEDLATWNRKRLHADTDEERRLADDIIEALKEMIR